MKLRKARLAAATLTFAAAASAQQLPPVRVNLDIPAQPLSAALNRFAHQAGLQVVFFSDEGDAFTAPALRGGYKIEEGLALLLENTSLRYEVIDSHTVAIRSARESVGKPGADASVATMSLMRLAQTSPAAVEQSTQTGGVDADDDGSRPDAPAAPPTLEEITVTAQKRIERLQDVPVPVTAIAGESLVNSNQLQLQDYYSKIPALSLTPTVFGPIISIRGLTTGGVGTSPTVGVVVDDVPFGASTGLGGGGVAPDFDPSELARVEVLRGPQGTFYGATSIGGLLKYVTVDPSTDAFSGRVQIGTHSIYNGDGLGYSARGSVNVPLNDTFAVRASALRDRIPVTSTIPAWGGTA
jgi:outer membrane receptor protein involved in Fe transport